MIARHRNLGIVYSLLALTATVLFVVALRKSAGIKGEWNEYLFPLYLSAAILWSMASYTLARAKGYDGDALGRVLIISLILGFCCQPAALTFPFLGFFLEDKTRLGRRSSRRRHKSKTGN